MKVINDVVRNINKNVYIQISMFLNVLFLFMLSAIGIKAIIGKK